MSKTVNLRIDGKEVQAPEGMNLIDAAETAGIHIPNLCYLKGMRGIGACRLCLVEIEGMKAPVIACTTRVKEGMNVKTSTEKIQEMRKFVIDLILSIHPLDCMTCTKAGVCTLQKYAYDFELKESTFTRKKFGYPIDEANPFIKRDPDYCILCGRCVRVCKEQGTNVLDFMGRGVGAKVITAMDKPLQESGCTFCGSCVDACPVNALLEADRWRKGREWEYTKIKSVCLSCGGGCDITVSTKEGSIIKINSGADEGSVEKYICAIGRFGFDSINSEMRITSPMKRVGAIHESPLLVETTWDDALKIITEKLKEAGKDTGFISIGGILNQDAFVLSKFVSDVVKTKNIDTTVSLYADADSMKYSDSADMDTVDLFIVVGLNPSQWRRVLPAFDASIRKRVARGAKLIVINSEETRLGTSANVTIRGNEAETLAQIAETLKGVMGKGQKAKEQETKDVEASLSEQVATLLLKAQNPVLFTAPSLFSASRNISLLTSAKVIAVPLEANARGVVTMGLNTEGKTYKEMVGRTQSTPKSFATGQAEHRTQSNVKVLYTIGEIPLNERPKGIDFLIVQNSYLTNLAKQADIVLPAATFLESEGTIINYLGKIKHLTKTIEPPQKVKQHKDIFVELSKVMGNPIKESAAKIKTAFEVTKPKFSPFERKEGLDVDPSEFFEAINQSVINSSRLLWLKEMEKTVV